MKFRRITHALSVMYRSLYFPPTVIFLAIIIATLFSWQAARNSLHADIQSAVQTEAARTETAIRNNMVAYAEVLRGGIGLFRGSSEVTQADWSRYLQAYDISQDYPDVQAFGFARITSETELPDLTAYMQAQGITDFAIRQKDPPRDTYAPVLYIERVAAKAPASFGFDMYADPARREALYRARDTGETAMTGRLIVNNSDTSVAPTAFNLFAPYYDPDLPTSTVTERRAAIRGYVFAAFRTQIFFTPIADATNKNNAGFRITVADDAGNGSLFASEHFARIQRQPGAIKTARSLKLYGETWHMDYVFDRSGIVSQVQLRRPPSVLLGGVFIASLIAIIVWLLLRARARELAAQKEHAVELAKDELLSLASHQLRTPATGVKQYVGMVLQGFAGDVPGEQMRLLEKAYASNDRQLQIINEILHLAKISSGRIVIARQPTNLNELVRDIVSEQEEDIKASRHKTEINLPTRPIVLSVDAHMLRMAIENLVSNAIKYTHPGGLITVKLYKNWRNVFIRVSDTGIGIASNDQPSLFKQFTRITNEMTQEVGGTGIGLFLAKSLVEQHGGTITVKSAPGKGSTFTIILPRESPQL
ncbi:MAG TPA: CHASE domain-containing protein [Candidatus Saccharimonadales bacterium]|nr:CHASE domain-containing protein [Candidatus Saccharimonadales bacterium]